MWEAILPHGTLMLLDCLGQDFIGFREADAPYGISCWTNDLGGMAGGTWTLVSRLKCSGPGEGRATDPATDGNLPLLITRRALWIS